MLPLCALGASFLAPVASLVQNGQRLPMLGTYVARLADVLDAAPEQSGSGPELPSPSGHIEVRGLGFRYAPSSPWVLRNVSFAASRGDVVAIVGSSGAGKTTLVDLIPRF